MKNFEEFIKESKGDSKLNILKKHLDRTNIDLASWIVQNLGVDHKGEMTEDEAVRIIRSVDNKEWWSKLPSMYFFDSPAENVKEGTILIHYTEDPERIQEEGFKYGEPDYLKLGMNWGRLSKREPGFNYAFEPKDVIEKYGSLEKGYTDWVRKVGGVVFFKAPAIKVWHFGDEIDQVLFWGPDAKDIQVAFHKKPGWEFNGEKFENLDSVFDLLY